MVQNRLNNLHKDYYLERIYRCNQADCRYNDGYGYLTAFSKDMIDHLIIEYDIDKPELYLPEYDDEDD